MAQHDPADGAIREGEPPYRGPVGPAAASRRHREWWLWLTVGLIAFAIVTAGKHFFNEIDLAFYNTYNSPETRFLADAESKNLLVSRFKIDPIKLVREDKWMGWGLASVVLLAFL